MIHSEHFPEETIRFRNRAEAGQYLAEKLMAYAHRPDVVVLALPRGGVPVAFEVAEVLDAPLDVFLVRKLGVPGHEELAMGAIASGGIRVLNEDLVGELRISEREVEAVGVPERDELWRRERVYRGPRAAAGVRGKTVILVDDGLATGSTMRAAAEAIRLQQPARIVAAVPVAAPSVCARMRDVVDEVVCVVTPEPFYAVGAWYQDFRPTSDQEVRDLLERAEKHHPVPSPITVAGSGDGAGSASKSIADAVRPLTGARTDYDAVLDLVGDARFVLIGEASHGTHEFYRVRAEITKRLIDEKGFTAVTAEADWPDAYRVNRFVRGAGSDSGADEALANFKRFPQWMWRNTVVVDFVEWLRARNEALPAWEHKVGFYGLDLYSLHASIDAVVTYLDRVDPEAARRARLRYGCFDHFGDDAQLYAYATEMGAAEPCEDEVVNQLLELQRRAGELSALDGRVAEDEYFH